MVGESERRRFPRLAAECPVRYRVIPEARPAFQGALVRDVSAGGVRFRTFSFMPRGARMLLELQLPVGPPIRAVGRAAWIRTLPDDDGYEVGSQFDDPALPLDAALPSRLSPEGSGSRSS